MMAAVAIAGVADWLLRDARWIDVPALTELEARLFADDAWSERAWWAELAGRPRRDYVVAHDSGGVVGYGGLDHGGEVADVMTVAVAPRARGHRLGHGILGALEQRARARGAAFLMLEVRADNAPARALYDASGFGVLSTRRGYYQPDGVDAFVMRKSLRDNGSGDEGGGGDGG